MSTGVRSHLFCASGTSWLQTWLLHNQPGDTHTKITRRMLTGLMRHLSKRKSESGFIHSSALAHADLNSGFRDRSKAIEKQHHIIYCKTADSLSLTELSWFSHSINIFSSYFTTKVKRQKSEIKENCPPTCPPPPLSP